MGKLKECNFEKRIIIIGKNKSFDIPHDQDKEDVPFQALNFIKNKFKEYEVVFNSDNFMYRNEILVIKTEDNISKIIKKFEWRGYIKEIKENNESLNKNKDRELLFDFASHLNEYKGFEKVRFDFMVQDYIEKKY